MRLPVWGVVGVTSDMVQIEDTEWISKFIPHSRFTKRIVFHNQLAFLQRCQIFRQGASGRKLSALDELTACEADAFRCECCHNALKLIRMRELWCKQPVELFLQRRIDIIEDGIDVLSQTQAFTELVQIEWYATESYIGLANIELVKMEAVGFEELATFIQCEWRKIDRQRYSAIQSTFVVDQFVQNPGRGATAYH